jgi:hypothetical protein
LQNQGNLQVFKSDSGESGWLEAVLEQQREITTQQSPYETPGIHQFQRNRNPQTAGF